jgi:O-antigen ligase
VLALEVLGVIPAWYAAHGEVGRNLLTFDLENYWLPLRELLGLDGRWGGYALFPNIQGQAGALLLVFGFTRPGVRRVAFVLTGMAVLLLTDSRTSYAAAAAGLVLLALLPGWHSAARRWSPARILALGLGMAMAGRVALKVLADPNLTGRLAVWPDFLSLASQNPALGAGAPAIDDAVAAGDLPGWADQGHNILIDTMVRFGAVGLVLAVGFLGLALAIGVRGARLGEGVALALAVALLVSCMGDLGLVWPYPSEGMSILILSVLLARRREDVPEQSAVERAAA